MNDELRIRKYALFSARLDYNGGAGGVTPDLKVVIQRAKLYEKFLLGQKVNVVDYCSDRVSTIAND